MLYSGAKETVFFTGADYFQSLLHDIAQAKLSIDLETYIFANDALAEQIVNALMQVAQRNVAVRVLVDGAGTPDWGESWAARLESTGVKTQIYHPFPWRFGQWRHAKIKKPILQKAIYLFSKINIRNHRKTCIIDNNIVYVGSFNISKCHLDNQQGGENWRDTGVRLQDIDCSSLGYAFEAVWKDKRVANRIKAIFKNEDKDPTFRLNNTRHQRRVLYRYLLRRIAHCKKRVWITNAYFIPDNFLLRKLKSVAKKGIDVRILLPSKSDIFYIPWTTATFYSALLKSKVRIFEYLPSILHAKTLIIDDWMIIGSTNLDNRSLLHNLEIDVNIKSVAAKQKIAQQFLTLGG